MYFEENETFLKCKQTRRILRCVHQEMIYPPYRNLRASFYDLYPFKDVHQSWYIEIHISTADGTVSVTHRKSQMAHSHKPEEFFAFEWHLCMTFTPKCPTFTASFFIDKDWYTPDGNLSQAQQQLEPPVPLNPKLVTDFRQAIGPFLHRSAAARIVWAKRLDLQSIASCLPRIASNFTLCIDKTYVPLRLHGYIDLYNMKGVS